jgi:hypothetical protein
MIVNRSAPRATVVPVLVYEGMEQRFGPECKHRPEGT